MVTSQRKGYVAHEVAVIYQMRPEKNRYEDMREIILGSKSFNDEELSYALVFLSALNTCPLSEMSDLL